MRCDERASCLPDILAGKLPLDELLVGSELCNLENSHAYEASEYRIWFAEIQRRIKNLHLASGNPAKKRPVGCESGCRTGRCRSLDHAPGRERMPYFRKAEATEVAGYHHKGQKAGEYQQERLERVDIQQPLYAAHHRIECGDQPEYEYAPDHEMELYAPEGYDAYGDCGYEKPAPGCEQLPDQEHDRCGFSGGLPEAFAYESVDGNGSGIVEFRKDEGGHHASSKDGPHKVHHIGEVGIEAQLRRAHECPRAYGGAGGGDGNKPARHRTPGQEVILHVPVFPGEKPACSDEGPEEERHYEPVCNSHNSIITFIEAVRFRAIYL